jgi:hypothetical protein
LLEIITVTVHSIDAMRPSRSVDDARVRERLVRQRTGIINKSAPSCWSAALRYARVTILRGELPRILATPPDVLSPRMLRIIEDLAGDWRRLDERVEGMSNEIEAIARQDAGFASG